MALPIAYRAIKTRPVGNAPCKFAHNTISGGRSTNNRRAGTRSCRNHRNCQAKTRVRRCVNKSGRASQCIEQARIAARTRTVAIATSQPSASNWRWSSQKQVAINDAASNTTPFHPNHWPAAATSTSLSHSLARDGPWYVCSRVSWRTMARCWIIQSPSRRCSAGSLSPLMSTMRALVKFNPRNRTTQSTALREGSHQRGRVSRLGETAFTVACKTRRPHRWNTRNASPATTPAQG